MHYIVYCIKQDKPSVNTLIKILFRTDAKALLAIAFTHISSRQWKLLPANKTTPSRKGDEVGKLSLKHNLERTLIE